MFRRAIEIIGAHDPDRDEGNRLFCMAIGLLLIRVHGMDRGMAIATVRSLQEVFEMGEPSRTVN